MDVVTDKSLIQLIKEVKQGLKAKAFSAELNSFKTKIVFESRPDKNHINTMYSITVENFIKNEKRLAFFNKRNLIYYSENVDELVSKLITDFNSFLKTK